MSKESFIFHYGYINAEEFSPEEIGLLTLAMIDYSRDGKEPAFKDRAMRTEWKRIKERMDDDIAAYEERCEKNRENGRLGGRPRKSDAEENRTVFEETERFSEKPKKPDSDSDSGSDSEYINTNCASAPPKKDVEALFEKLWQQYPDKKGKGKVSAADKRRLFEIGFEHMQRAINRYVDGLKRDEWRHPQNGSTFFHSGYIDYLDQNYSPPENKPPNARSGPKQDPLHAGKGKTGFSNFGERSYDFRMLERQLEGAS